MPADHFHSCKQTFPCNIQLSGNPQCSQLIEDASLIELCHEWVNKVNRLPDSVIVGVDSQILLVKSHCTSLINQLLRFFFKCSPYFSVTHWTYNLNMQMHSNACYIWSIRFTVSINSYVFVYKYTAACRGSWCNVAAADIFNMMIITNVTWWEDLLHMWWIEFYVWWRAFYVFQCDRQIVVFQCDWETDMCVSVCWRDSFWSFQCDAKII